MFAADSALKPVGLALDSDLKSSCRKVLVQGKKQLISNGKVTREMYGLFFLAGVIFTMQSGCSPLSLGKAANIQTGARRMHFVEGEPFVCLNSLVDNRNNVAGVLVRVQSYKTAMDEFRNQQTAVASKTNTTPSTTPRVMVLTSQRSVHLVADGQPQLLDTRALSGGPWIYYLNDAEPFRRIQVPAENVWQFVADLNNLPPPEFAEKWCDNQPAAELLSDFIPSQD